MSLSGLTAVFLAASAPVHAQAPLTLDDALRQAIGRNAGLRAARAASAEDDARVDEARSGWFPRVSISESWQRGDQPVYVFSSLLSARQFAASNFAIDTLNHPGALVFFHTSLGIEQLLFDGGAQRAATAAAALGREISSLAVDERAVGVAVSTTEAYGRVLAADAGVRAAEAALAAARDDLVRAGHRRDAGMATDADVLALAAYGADVEQRTIRLRGDAAIARAQLNELLGSPIDTAYDIREPEHAATVDETASLASLLAEADAARPELKRAGAASRLAEHARSAARSAFAPRILARGAYDISGTRIGDRTGSWLVGGDLRWTLSLGGAESARIRAASEGVARAAAEADEARARVHVEVVAALRRLEAARARGAVGRAAVEQARESQRIVRDRFDAGLAGVTDVLRASTAVLDAEAQRTSALIDAMVSGAMLRRAVGRPF